MERRIFVSIQSRGQFVLPAEIRRRHHLNRPGAQVEIVERDDGVIELRPRLPIPADQAWFWEERWQEGERRVDEHIRAGEVTVSDDVDEFVADLDAVRSRPR